VKATPEDCFHLTIEIVREIHDEAVKIFGGLHGIRDEALLASAVFAPQSSFGGKSPYVNLVDIAAAYLFYLGRNHPFLDGNKRTAMAAAIVFLRLNGFDPAADSDDWERLVLDVASAEIDREQATRWLRKLVRKMA
jgi:death-on-curing protein